MGNPATKPSTKPQSGDDETPLESEQLNSEYDNTGDGEDELIPSVEKPAKSKVATVATAGTGHATKTKSEDVDDEHRDVEPVQHSPRILRMCKELNIGDDEIEGLSKEALEIFVSREMSRQLKAAKVGQVEDRELDRKKKEKEEEDAELEIDWGEGEDESGNKRKFTKDDVHPALRNVIVGLVKEIKSLKGEKAEDAKAAQQKQMDQFTAAFDASCSRFTKTLGKGTLSDLEGTPQAKKRVAMFKEVCDIMSKNKGIRLDQAVEQAAEELYGAKLATVAKPKAKPKVESEEDEEEDEQTVRRQGYTQGKTVRPTGRKDKKAKGASAAEEAVERWLEDNPPGDDVGSAADDGDEGEY